MIEALYANPELQSDDLAWVLTGAKIHAMGTNCSLGVMKSNQYVPAIAPDKKNRAVSYFLPWGYPMDTGKLYETVRLAYLDKAKEPFLSTYRNHRCIVPVHAYHIVVGRKGRQERYAVSSADGSPLLLAGVYFRKRDIPRVVLVTAPGNGDLGALDGQLPIIIPRKSAGTWMTMGRSFKFALSQIPNRGSVVETSGLRFEKLGNVEERTK